MIMVVVFEFSGIRCQPLRRALCVLEYRNSKWKLIFFLICQLS
ncbi:acetyltransferase [Vibrio cholerae]|nr:acetyltransferase [Vibrio cholerae]